MLHKLLFTALLLTLFNFSGLRAQSLQALKIKDLSVMPSLDDQLDSTEFHFEIFFKVNDPSKGNKVSANFGNAPNNANNHSAVGDILHSGSNHKISYSGLIFPIENHSASMRVSIPKNKCAGLSHLTIFVEGANNQKSNSLSISLQ